MPSSSCSSSSSSSSSSLFQSVVPAALEWRALSRRADAVNVGCGHSLRCWRCARLLQLDCAKAAARAAIAERRRRRPPRRLRSVTKDKETRTREGEIAAGATTALVSGEKKMTNWKEAAPEHKRSIKAKPARKQQRTYRQDLIVAERRSLERERDALQRQLQKQQQQQQQQHPKNGLFFSLLLLLFLHRLLGRGGSDGRRE